MDSDLWSVVLFLVLHNLGLYYNEKRMFHEAIATLEECVAGRKSFLPAQHQEIGTSLFLVHLFSLLKQLFVCFCFSALLHLGFAYKNVNNTVKASQCLKESLSIFKKSLSPVHPNLAEGMPYCIQNFVVAGILGTFDCMNVSCCVFVNCVV